MKKSFVKLLLMFFIAGLFIFLGNGKVFAAQTDRTAGKDRYDTSLQISKSNWKAADTVILATGNDFADALCATPLAKKYNAPIILIDTNGNNDNALQEINRLGAKNIYLIGGEGVIPKSIEDNLKKLGKTTHRLAGIDRFDTSLAIAKEMGTTTKVVLAIGDKFPDAISVSAPAALEGMPILLSAKDGVSDKVDKYITSVKREKVYIVGGSDIISDTVKNKYNAIRLSGDNRVDTNLAVLKEFSNDFKMSKIFVASALDFPDGLSGAAAAVLYQAPVLLVCDGYMNSTMNYVSANIDNSSASYEILGGISAVSSKIQKELELGKLYTQTIVVDPGHNYGKDYGCEYKFNGVTYSETELNIQVAAKLRDRLVQYGFNVIMTRDVGDKPMDDLNTSLQKRVDIANNSDAVLFISLHHDAVDNNTTANGISTHYSTWRPNIDTSGVVTDSDGINHDTTPSEAAVKSAELAKQIGVALASLGYKNNGVRDHNLFVTRNTNMPSILVECGFLSNPQEAVKCANASEQQKKADKIAEVINNYFNK